LQAALVLAVRSRRLANGFLVASLLNCSMDSLCR
jgi:hypothetical protein